ncbi:MAG: hypothetical protein ACPGWR_22595, partial [Ardenticatenaceae bacterium]
LFSLLSSLFSLLKRGLDFFPKREREGEERKKENSSPSPSFFFWLSELLCGQPQAHIILSRKFLKLGMPKAILLNNRILLFIPETFHSLGGVRKNLQFAFGS